MVKDGNDKNNLPPESEHLSDAPENSELKQKLQK